jgi:hypothetical protein
MFWVCEGGGSLLPGTIYTTSHRKGDKRNKNSRRNKNRLIPRPPMDRSSIAADHHPCNRPMAKKGALHIHATAPRPLAQKYPGWSEDE